MTLWREGEPLSSAWEQTAIRASDGVKFRRVGKSGFESASQYNHTEDLYQMLVNDQVVAEEIHRRSPATRSYGQAQARTLFEQAGFRNVQLYSQFTFDPVKPEDTVFVVVGQKLADSI